MLFNSSIYFIFLPLVASLYFVLPLYRRRYLLLFASYFFYGWWSVPFCGLLILSTILDYTVARVIDSSESRLRRRIALLASVFGNLGVLSLFKYADFFSSSSFALFGARPWPELDLMLPLGISFYTFQTMSYTIDVYRGHLRARESFLDVALYVSFFPQLVAGPIIRADTLIPQLRGNQEPDWLLIRSGIALIAWGMAKKVFIADAMGPIVNEAYAAPGAMSGLALLSATYAFAVQIYCDFSGYSDIAVGSALVLGIRLPENFRQPYLSCSIREFWRRWHISLSSWLRDYLYIPLGGSRLSPSRTQINLMITMLLGGLWHGAGWNWVVWGGLQGVLMSIERVLSISEEPPQEKHRFAIRWFVTFHLVCFSWIFFRSTDIDQAFEVVHRIATFAPGLSFALWQPIFFIALLVAVELANGRQKFVGFFQHSPKATFWLTVLASTAFLLAFRGISNPEFIYFQF
jgi:alginate O-acetyltransferase complex protein AlgI